MSVINVIDQNDGRNRRKVKFRSDDMNFSDLDESDTQDDDESDIDDVPVDKKKNNSDSDSEWSDSEEESNEMKEKNDKSRFYGQSFKEGKENEIRKKIANELAKLDKINQESNTSSWNEQDQNYSENDMEYDEDSDVEDESSENEVDTKLNESDENNDLSDTEKNEDFASNALTNGLYGENEDTTLNWKKNLARKATNAYYERQNTVANLWKLVYGKLFLL